MKTLTIASSGSASTAAMNETLIATYTGNVRIVIMCCLPSDIYSTKKNVGSKKLSFSTTKMKFFKGVESIAIAYFPAKTQSPIQSEMMEMTARGLIAATTEKPHKKSPICKKKI